MRMRAPEPVPGGRARIREHTMADKSPRQTASKKSGLSIKEKRAVKKGKKGGQSSSIIPPK
jgi:hypothetical protein